MESKHEGQTPAPKGGRWEKVIWVLLFLCLSWAIQHDWNPKPQVVLPQQGPSFAEALNKAFPPLPAPSARKSDGHPGSSPTLAEYFSALQATQPPPKALPVLQEFSWEPLDVFFGHLYPSIALARPMRGQHLSAKDAGESLLGDYPNSPYSAKVISPPGKTVRLEIRCDELMEPSVSEVTIEKGGVWVVNVRIKWKFSALRLFTQVRPVNITWNLSVDGKALPSQSRTVLVQPVDVMPLSYLSPSGMVIDLSHYLAAYANEDHPMLDSILKEALGTGVVSSFDGMASQDPNQVVRQVFAIWWALQKRGIVYSSIAEPVVSGNSAFIAQRIRLFDDVIQSRQANCIDGTLVFASLLRRIGLKPLICLKPEHAFLGFYLDDAGQKVTFLETTDLNNRSTYVAAVKSLASASPNLTPNLSLDLGPETQTCPTTRALAEEMFGLAMNRGVETALAARQARDAGKEYYNEIDLFQARQSILPIPSEVRQ